MNRYSPLGNFDGDSGEAIFSMDDAVTSLGFGKMQYKLIFVAAFVEASDAMEALLLTYLSFGLDCEKNWRSSSFELVQQKSILSTVVFVGMLFGAMLWGILGDKCGRKPTLTMTAVMLSFFGILSAFTQSFYALVLCRFLVGIGENGTFFCFSL